MEALDDRHRTTFSGLSGDFRFAILDRGPGSPVGLTFGVSPGWDRIDGGTGSFTRAFGSTVTVIADTELVANRLYAAANLSYGVDVDKAVGDADWSRGSATGVTGALAYRISPRITVGSEIQYYRAYDGLLLHAFQGHALYAGPTLHLQISSKTMLAAAFSTQVAGHALGDARTYDLTNFEHYRANLKFEVEF